jgi:putative hydrolase of the HAD superfamily
MELKVIVSTPMIPYGSTKRILMKPSKKFCGLMEDYLSHQGISKELFKVEIDNLKLYGYGIKGYILSMIEAAMTISNNTIPIEIIEKIIQYGKNYSRNQLFYWKVSKKL